MRTVPLLRRICPMIAGLLASVGESPRAETLGEALRSAYETNPTLLQQRVDQRALEETVVQARGAGLPTLSVQVTTQYQRTDLGRPPYSGASTVAEVNNMNPQIIVSQPVYTGGRIKAAVNAAEADVLAGQHGLRSGENQILQQVVQAYADVLRDARVLEIRQESVTDLESELAEAQAKASVGQLTRVDVAQALGQLAAARVDLTSANAQLRSSQATYIAVVGHPPDHLLQPRDLPGLPGTLVDAIAMAEKNNPKLLEARENEKASRFRVEQARAERRPTLVLQGSFGPSGPIAPFDPRGFDRTITTELVLSQALFTGNITSSRIRQAIQRAASDRMAVEGVIRTVDESMRQAWSALTGAAENAKTGEEEIAAQTVAFEGVREQYRLGLVTTTDVLIQEDRLRTAQLTVASARHDVTVCQAAIITNVGLGLSGPDPGVAGH